VFNATCNAISYTNVYKQKTAIKKESLVTKNEEKIERQKKHFWLFTVSHSLSGIALPYKVLQCTLLTFRRLYLTACLLGTCFIQ
jgi:archaellum biogenesis protein FlaJ (TadC family)